MDFITFDPTRRRSSKTTKSAVLPPKSAKDLKSPSLSSVNKIDTIPQSCLASSYHARAHGAILEQYGPSVIVGSLGSQINPRSSVGSSWLYSAYNQAYTDGLLSDSLAALSLAYHERQNDLGRYALGSRVLYGKAMKALSWRLATGKRALDDSTLAAAMLLVTFEESLLHHP